MQGDAIYASKRESRLKPPVIDIVAYRGGDVVMAGSSRV